MSHGGSAATRSAKIRAVLDHPVVDADGHWLEPVPIFCDFLRDVGGAAMVDRFRALWRDRLGKWHDATPRERLRRRVVRTSSGEAPTDTLDRATAMVPGLLCERLEEFGIDFAVVYPSLGLMSPLLPEEDVRRAMVRANNNMCAELFRPYERRMAAVATIPSYTPAEAIEELEYSCGNLGLKAIYLHGNLVRPVPAAGSEDPRDYLDSLGLDNIDDYDPFWAKAVEHGVAITFHGGSYGWIDHASPTNFVFNHVGHFAQANHAIARALFLGGVPSRFPDLNFAFLEGGAAWACSLLLDLAAHWEKRNADAVRRNLNPANVDVGRFRALLEEYGGRRLGDRVDDILGSPSLVFLDQTFDELQAQEEAQWIDDFAALAVHSREELTSLFRQRFYIGCEADDRTATWAFDTRLDLRLKAMFSSDVGHFDVPDMTKVMEEAYELVEDGLLDAEQFRAFTFVNPVLLHAEMNPNFFAGTVVEDAVEQLREAGTR
jgi:predicted TIM-barrel fold metal-dependent hydrolase